MKENLVYLDNKVSVQVSPGPFITSISLEVRQIRPVNQDFLLLPYMTSDSNDKMQSFASLRGLEYAIYDYGIDQVKSLCLEYINTVSKFPVKRLENATVNTSNIIWRSLEAIRGFLKENRVVRKASTSPSPWEKSKHLIGIVE
jgi:hypothetical protein